MTAEEFSDERTTALRQLLLDTIADEPRRRRRFQLALTSILAAVAVVLAGGTAALAMTGVIHFGAPAPQPAPATPSGATATPSATPTPSSGTARAIRIQSGPITTQDVTALPSKPSWSLDLPGTVSGCQDRSSYDIADGLALFVVGSNLGFESTADCPIGHGNASLTMVDTEKGRILWSREWNWDGDHGRGTALTVLGTSNRVIFSGLQVGIGPRDIIDLATGTTIATLPGDLGDDLLSRLEPVWDGSGDVVWGKPNVDAAGNTVSYDLRRVNPEDFSRPLWSTPLAATTVSLNHLSLAASGRVPFEYLSSVAGVGPRSSLIDLDTGAIGPDAESAAYVAMSSVIVQYRDFGSGVPRTIAGVDPSTGATIWSKPFPDAASLSEVHTVNGRPGRPPGIQSSGEPTGDLVTISSTSLTLFDGVSGDVTMKADITHCGLDGWFWGNPGRDVLFDPVRNSIVIVRGDKTCSVDRDTGAPTPLADHSTLRWPLFGPTATYIVDSVLATPGVGRAFDRRSGAELWSTPVAKNETWSFTGGVLVRRIGNQIESVG